MRPHLLTTSSAVLLLLLGGALAPSASAAGTDEVVAYDAGRIAVSTPPGAPPTGVRGHGPAVSPDGSRLAWASSEGDLSVGAVDGSGARQVTSGPAWDAAPAWSPDGTRLAFTRLVPSGEQALWTVRADGTGAAPVGADGDEPVWSPDGRFLAFDRVGGGAPAVLAVDADGGAPAVLTTGVRVEDWSPDGTALALTRGGSDVLRYALGDRTSRTVLAGVDDVRYLSPRFSGSGRQLYLDRVSGTKADLASVLQRWSLDGVQDTSLPSASMDFGGDIGVGGGLRATPTVTAPASVTGLTADVAPSRVTLRFARPQGATAAGVTVRYAIGTTPPATVGDGLDGGDTLASVHVLRHLAPSTVYSASVFARDWSGASSAAATVSFTTPAEVATTLTLSGPGTLTYGQSSTLAARLVREDTGAPVPGARLALLGHHTGDLDSPLATLTTDDAGRATTTRRTSEATRYTLRYAGDGPLLPAAAGALVLVRQRVTVSFSPSDSVPAHRPARVTVTVAPASPGGRVRVQQRVYGATPVDVVLRQDRYGRASTALSTARREASASGNVVVTPGARRGYLSDPFSATLVVS
ncbi:MAG: TolB-related protein [Frankiales bacterium]|nr:TolB-related protein [Frankiales bacterium]